MSVTPNISGAISNGSYVVTATNNSSVRIINTIDRISASATSTITGSNTFSISVYNREAHNKFDFSLKF